MAKIRPTLLDQLYYNIDITAGSQAEAPQHPPSVPVTKTPEVGTTMPTDVTGMKFTHSLIKHLDMIYSKMLAGEISEIANEEEDPDVKYIAGLPMVEKHSYYNTGNSNVTESF